MLFLIDSNVAIASDPLSSALEPGARATIDFLHLAGKYHHDIRTHPASLVDIARITDLRSRAAREVLFGRYAQIEAPPVISLTQSRVLGIPAVGSNDEVDQLLIAAISANAAEYLVTEDRGIHRAARRLRIDDRVLTVADALAVLHALHADLPNPPPAVQRVKAHQLELGDPIFDSLKSDYADFDRWFIKAARTQRDAFLVQGDGAHAAVAILKDEHSGEYGLPGPVLKISTFKVASGYSGQKYGELLLKAVFNQAHASSYRWIYVTVFEKHTPLVELLEDFGFEPLPGRSPLSEVVYAKPCHGQRPVGMGALEYHRRYGPPALAIEPGRVFLIPIEPRWHRALFPDAEPPDDALLPATAGLTTHPFGNALRKAYLCNSPSRLLRAGDTLLFYRSTDEQAVYVLGVCEEVAIGTDAQQIATAVGRRTVYSVTDIDLMTRKGPVLMVLFRQDRILREDPIELDELKASGAIRSWPQSITRLRSGGEPWLAKRLNG